MYTPDLPLKPVFVLVQAPEDKSKLYPLHPSNNLEHWYRVDHEDKIEMAFFFQEEKELNILFAFLKIVLL